MILIAMAGKSSRFFAQGYTQPKYELLVGDKTLFQLSVESFASYFHSEHFVFVTRAEFSARKFIEEFGVISKERILFKSRRHDRFRYTEWT